MSGCERAPDSANPPSHTHDQVFGSDAPPVSVDQHGVTLSTRLSAAMPALFEEECCIWFTPEGERSGSDAKELASAGITTSRAIRRFIRIYTVGSGDGQVSTPELSTD